MGMHLEPGQFTNLLPFTPRTKGAYQAGFMSDLALYRESFPVFMNTTAPTINQLFHPTIHPKIRTKKYWTSCFLRLFWVGTCTKSFLCPILFRLQWSHTQHSLFIDSWCRYIIWKLLNLSFSQHDQWNWHQTFWRTLTYFWMGGGIL